MPFQGSSISNITYEHYQDRGVSKGGKLVVITSFTVFETHAAVDPNISALRALVSSPTTAANRHVKRTIIPTRSPMERLEMRSNTTIAPMSSTALRRVLMMSPAYWIRRSG